MAKLSSTGALQWDRGYGGAADQEALGLALTADGDPIIVGSTGGTVDFGAGPLVPAGSKDAFVAKLSR